MTEFIFIRHGTADYSNSVRLGLKGHGHDLAALTDGGVKEIEALTQNEILKTAEIIVVSPYTRTMQTATIINKELALDMIVDIDLREWEPDQTYQYGSGEYLGIAKEFDANKGIWPPGTTQKWETIASVKERASAALNKYDKYKCVIVVAHRILIRAITGKNLGCGEYTIFKMPKTRT